jgi:exonuclease III
MDHNRTISTINMLQWNAQSLRPKRTELEALLNQEKIHILLISETWLDPDSAFKIKGYNIFRRDRSDGYGGVAIMTHWSLKAHRSDISTRNERIELVNVEVENCEHLKNIVSVYCAPNISTTMEDWNSIFTLTKQKSLIAGDFNAHHSNWSSDRY